MLGGDADLLILRLANIGSAKWKLRTVADAGIIRSFRHYCKASKINESVHDRLIPQHSRHQIGPSRLRHQIYRGHCVAVMSHGDADQLILRIANVLSAKWELWAVPTTGLCSRLCHYCKAPKINDLAHARLLSLCTICTKQN